MFDDPKQFAPVPLDWAVNVLELSFVVAIPLLIGLAVWNWRKVLTDWRYSVLIGVFAAGLLAVLILSTAYDPGRVWEWFWD
jgi:predicted membrane channel-forming protein YqfA (hemolysin III family)